MREVAAAVVRLATTRYAGANHTHLAELLREHEGLDVSGRTVHRILARAGIASPRRRRPPEHRVRRERMRGHPVVVKSIPISYDEEVARRATNCAAAAELLDTYSASWPQSGSRSNAPN